VHRIDEQREIGQADAPGHRQRRFDSVERPSEPISALTSSRAAAATRSARRSRRSPGSCPCRC
jgi:hypothetical protein